LWHADVELFDDVGASIEIARGCHRPPGGVKVAKPGLWPLIRGRFIDAVDPIENPVGAAERSSRIESTFGATFGGETLSGPQVEPYRVQNADSEGKRRRGGSGRVGDGR
jgi:hypothetical protein